MSEATAHPPSSGSPLSGAWIADPLALIILSAGAAALRVQLAPFIVASARVARSIGRPLMAPGL
jgi:hypothetical protein